MEYPLTGPMVSGRLYDGRQVRESDGLRGSEVSIPRRGIEPLDGGTALVERLFQGRDES